MVDDLADIKFGELLRVRAPDGSEILVERIILGLGLGWSLEHRGENIITRDVARIRKYIDDCANHEEIMDLGEF